MLVSSRKTQLLFTHRNDAYMRVYTARISQNILERFRYPNRPPTTSICHDTTPSALIKIEHVRIPYAPNDTFRCRMLAALSIATTTMSKHIYFNPPKRKASCDVVDPYGITGRKRFRQESARDPLETLDQNRYHE